VAVLEAGPMGRGTIISPVDDKWEECECRKTTFMCIYSVNIALVKGSKANEPPQPVKAEY
jgi:hypothetical protein